MDGRASARLQAFLAACEAAGIEARLSDDIQRDIWEKFCFLAAFAGATARARAPIGAVRENATAWQEFTEMVREAAAVGRAMGVHLPKNLEARIVEFASGIAPAMKSSMLVDLENGRRLELDWLTGAVARLGPEHGVDTPVSSAVSEALAPYRNGADNG
jgi:2-dehydropantoate 2-reductase